jgi:glucosylceramidase
MSELCCMHDTAAPGSYADGDVWAAQIVGDLKAGASAWIYWNMILDETGGPWLVSPEHEDGDPNSQSAVVHIDRRTHEVTYTPLYYYLSHFSRFVRPGSVRIGDEVAGDGVTSVAFRRPDGAIVTELVNSGGETTVRVGWRGLSLGYTLPGRSITTLVWPG